MTQMQFNESRVKDLEFEVKFFNTDNFINLIFIIKFEILTTNPFLRKSLKIHKNRG